MLFNSFITAGPVLISHTSSQFSNSVNFKHAILGAVRVMLESISVQLKYNLTTNDKSLTTTPLCRACPIFRGEHSVFCCSCYQVTVVIRCQKPSWGSSQHLVPCNTQFLLNMHTSK